MIFHKEALDAAAEALFDVSQELDQENSWDDPLPDEWRESWRDAAREALEAALPHIREQIAREIEEAAAAHETRADERHDMQDALLEVRGMSIAARIARGVDQP